MASILHCIIIMPDLVLYILDIFFVIFHSLLILFIMFGWIHRRLRLAHLICVLLTGGSWFILGIFYGMGFCPLTQWHWNVLHSLGKYGLPTSYVQYILDRLLGINISASAADSLTLYVWLAALMISLYLFFKKRIKRRKVFNEKHRL